MTGLSQSYLLLSSLCRDAAPARRVKDSVNFHSVSECLRGRGQDSVGTEERQPDPKNSDCEVTLRLSITVKG